MLQDYLRTATPGTRALMQVHGSRNHHLSTVPPNFYAVVVQELTPLTALTSPIPIKQTDLLRLQMCLSDVFGSCTNLFRTLSNCPQSMHSTAIEDG
jgi:hypothetical protein